MVVHLRIEGSSNAYTHRVRAPPHVLFLFLFSAPYRRRARGVRPSGMRTPPPRRARGRAPRRPVDDGRGRRSSTRVDARGGRDDDDGGDDDDDASRVRRREARDAREGERWARVVARARERVAGDARGDDAGDASGKRTGGRAREGEREGRRGRERDGGGGGRGHGER